ncbi:hypothetical protein GCM10009740_31900 [Terrabacter terrae]|uniref:Uncharacterized protein n=1 Tax=Terrabacter terrae TaxID=318434 RepID=A0ABN2UKB2_9MICO
MPHHPFRAVSVAIATLLAALHVPSASAVAGETTATGDAVVTMVSPEAGSTVQRGFTAAFDVALGDQDDTTLTATFAGDEASRTVTRAQCADTCRVELYLEPLHGFLDAGTGTTSGYLRYTWTTPSGEGHALPYLTFASPAIGHDSTRMTTPTPNTAGYAATVVDTTTTLKFTPTQWIGCTPNCQTPAAGETVEVRVYPSTGPTPPAGDNYLQRTVAEWTKADTAWEASATLDFSALPEGSYSLYSRGRSADGWYAAGTSYDYRPIIVRHTPAMSIDMDATPDLVGTNRVATVTLRGPLADKVGYVEVTRDGVVLNPGDDQQWWPSTLTRPEVTASRLVDLGTASVGHHTVSTRMLVSTTFDKQVGAPVTGSYDVVSLNIKVTPGVAFVGRASSLGISADAPAGRVIDLSAWEFTNPDGTTAATGTWCSACGQHGTGSAAFMPQAAGTAGYTVTADAGSPYVQAARGTFPVYAARAVESITAPATRYGSTQKVTLTLRDERAIYTRVPTPAGVPVTVQFRKTGTTAWVTLGSTKTVTGGTATFTYVSRSNGQVRALYATPAPGVTWSSAAAAVTSTAAATITSAPTSTYRYRTVTVKATTYPYQSGARVWLQTRVHGTATWKTVKSIAAPTTGMSSLTTSFSTRGTYDLRVIRTATSLNTIGYSATRYLKVL